MIKTVNGKSVNIPDKEIESYMKSLDLTKEQAIEMWLDDEGYTDNEEQLELEKKAKESGIMRDIHGASATDKAKKTTPKTVKVSEEKQQLFNDICCKRGQYVRFSAFLYRSKRRNSCCRSNYKFYT